MAVWTDGDVILFTGPWPFTSIELARLRRVLRQTPRARWGAVIRAALAVHDEVLS